MSKEADYVKNRLGTTIGRARNARGNVTRMKEYIQEAITKNCDLIIFPELCIPGYFIGDNWDQTDYMNECISLGEEIRTLSENITVIFGNVALEKEKINP